MIRTLKHDPLPWAAVIVVTLASCALDTTGYLFSPSIDAPADEGREDRVDEARVDPPADEGGVPELEVEETVDLVVEEAFSCTPGEPCPDGKLCCAVGGILGCHDTADGCDCSGDDVLCTSHGLICCQVDLGVFACRLNLAGCLCGGPEDSARCGDGLLCCGTVAGGDFLCQPDSEGCFCDPSAADVEVFCGEAKRCCGKPDDQPRCHTDTSGCPCEGAGFNPAECGEVYYHCCDRGEGMRCGTEENCLCSSHLECGANRVCCDLLDGTIGVKRCRSSACACQCTDMPEQRCNYLGEDYSCFGIDTFSYCYKSVLRDC